MSGEPADLIGWRGKLPDDDVFWFLARRCRYGVFFVAFRVSGVFWLAIGSNN